MKEMTDREILMRIEELDRRLRLVSGTSSTAGTNTTTVVYATTAGTADHTALSNIGSNTHPQIDSHLASVANPHSVTAAQAAALALAGGTMTGPILNLVDRAKVQSLTTTGATSIYPAAAATTPYRLFKITLGGDHAITLDVTGAADGDSCVVMLNTTATPYTPTWVNVDWGTSTEPNWSDTGKWDFATFVYESVSGEWKGMPGGLGYAIS